MLHTVNLGTLPANEELPEGMATHRVCQLWCRELKRAYHRHTAYERELPEGCKLLIQKQGYGIDDSYEVFAVYSSDDKAAGLAAYWLEENLPKNWSPSIGADFKELVQLLT